MEFRLQALALLLCLRHVCSNPTPAKAEPYKKLGDVFNIWGMNGENDPPGKFHLDDSSAETRSQFLDPDSPVSCEQFYDSTLDIGEKEEGEYLNLHWDHIIHMNTAAVRALSDAGLKDKLNQNHAKAFFGLSEWPKALDQEVLKQVRGVYGDIDAILRGKGQLSEKPILACGSQGLLTVQEPTDELRGTDGQVMKDEQTGEVKTIRDRFGDDADEYLIYWFTPRGQDELPVDPKTGKAHYCSFPGQVARAFDINNGQTEKEQILTILCPSELQYSLGLDEDYGKAQDIGTSLDGKENSPSLYHILIDLLDIDTDGPEKISERYSAYAKQKQGWPHLKDSWALHDFSPAAPIGALYQQLYDRAEPRETNIRELMSINSYFAYSGFGLVSYMSSLTKQDWSSGLCRKPGSPFSLPTAIGHNTPNSEQNPSVKFTQQELEAIAKKQAGEAESSKKGGPSGA